MVVAAFADVGKGTKEVLSGTKEGVFKYGESLSLSTKTADGVSLLVSAIRAGDKADLSLKTSYNRDGYGLTALLKTGSDYVDVTATADRIAPGLKASVSATLPDPQAGKLTLDYSHPFGHLTTVLGLGAKPKASLALTTALYGNFLLGAEGSLDLSSNGRVLDTYGLAAGYMGPDSQLVLRLTDELTTARLSAVHNYARGRAVAAEVSRPLQGGDVDFTVGIQQRLDNGALVKAKVDQTGLASFLYEQRLSSGERVTLSAQMDAAAPGARPPKVGVAFDLA